MISFRRIDEKGKEVIVVCNFCPVERTGYEIGVPKSGSYVPVLSSDDAKYGGAGTVLVPVKAKKKEQHGLPYSVSLTLPALSTVIYERHVLRNAKGEEPGEKAAPAQKTADAQPAQTARAEPEAPKPRKKPGRKPKAEATPAAEAPAPAKPGRKPRAKKEDGGEAKPKTRKPAAKKAKPESK